MAVTSYAVNANEARKLWSAKLFHESTANTFWGKFVGKDSSSLIQHLTDTEKDKGDRVRVILRMLLSGDGVSGDATQEGNEEALTTYKDDLLIDQLRHATRSGGKMTEQRVPFDVREENRMALQDWWVERLDTAMANQLTGYTGQANLKYTGMNATVAPSSANSVTRIVIGGGHASEASLSATTTHAIKLSDLDSAVALAKTQQPRIRPVRIDGSDMFVAFLHPYQIKQLRSDTGTTGNFYDIQKAVLQGGKISTNPIMTGGNFIYNNVIVHEWAYLPNTVNAPSSQTNYRRGVFCGAQAAVFALGQGGSPNKMDWNEELFDYGNQLGVSAGMIFGIKKTQYNSIDFATIALSGYAPVPVGA